MTAKDGIKENAKEERTLQLRLPFGKTTTLALVILAAALALAELALRSDFVRDKLPAPSIASGHRRLDLKLAYLDRLVEKEGRVDCIFMGESMAHAAIDPELFSRVYETHTKKRIVCFNFGLDGFIPPAAAPMAEILVKKYRPRLLVWGLSPASFSKKFKKKTKKIVENAPWCRYWLGDWNFAGWLTEHSRVYRYFLRWRTWLERPGYSLSLSQREARMSRYGFQVNPPRRRGAFEPDPERTARFRNIVGDFEIAEEAAAALERFIGLRTQTEIVIVEIPIHPSSLSLYDAGADRHRRTAAYIGEKAKAHGVWFIPTMHLDLVPDEGWTNRNHVNHTGALIFSRWLGETIATAVQEKRIKDPGGEGI